MSKCLTIFAVALGLMMVPASKAEAQVDIGVQVPYNTEENVDALGIGARVGAGIPLAGVGVSGDFNWYFPDCGVADDCQFWEIVGNATYTIPTVGVAPYFGAGVAFQNASAEGAGVEVENDETGLNLLAGVKLGSVIPINAFGELSYRLMDEGQFVVAVGLLF